MKIVYSQEYKITYFDDCGAWLYTCKDKADYDQRIAILNARFDAGLINYVHSIVPHKNDPIT